MKITLPRVAPRNPLVRPARMRQAGAHGPTGGAQRQKSTRELRRELDRMSAHGRSKALSPEARSAEGSPVTVKERPPRHR